MTEEAPENHSLIKLSALKDDSSFSHMKDSFLFDSVKAIFTQGTFTLDFIFKKTSHKVKTEVENQYFMGMSGKSASDLSKIIVSYVGVLRINHLLLQLIYSGQYKNFLQSKQCKITLAKRSWLSLPIYREELLC